MKAFDMDEYVRAPDLFVVGFVHFWRPKYPTALCGTRVVPTKLLIKKGTLCFYCERYMRELIYMENGL